MHKQIRALTLTGLLAAGLTASVAMAQDMQQNPPPPAQDSGQPSSMGGMQHHMPNPDQQLKHMTKQLNLSADQQSQIKPILDDHQQQMQQMMQDQSMSKPDRRQKMRSLNQDTHSKIEAVLNDQQKQKFEAMMQKQQMHRQGMQDQNGGAAPDSGGAPPPPAQPQQ